MRRGLHTGRGGAFKVLPAGLAVVICAVGYALSAILVRILGRTDSTESMVFWVLTLMGVGATLLALPQWRPTRSASDGTVNLR